MYIEQKSSCAKTGINLNTPVCRLGLMRKTDRQIKQLSGLTNKQFKAKYKVKKKGKKQKREWWYKLTPDERERQLVKWQGDKAAKRIAKSIQIMKKAKVKHNCKTCFHGITKNCTNNLKWGCEYWFNTQSTIRGLAFKHEGVNSENKAEWAAKVQLKNKWLKWAS